MAAPAELGDFFAKNKKKKVKGSNLNNTSAATKTEEKKTKTSKDKDDDEWQEEHVETAEMKVAVAGKLTRDEEKKEDEDTTAPAWGSIKNKGAETSQNLSDKRFPSLAKSVQSSNINLDDGSEGKINIKTTKNAFAALENDADDDEELPKRPKEIKPAMVQKKKGEAEKAAIEREVDKYGGKKGEKVEKGEDTEKRKTEKKKKDKKKKEEEDDDEEEEADDDDEAQEDEEDGRKKKEKKKKDSKPAEMKAEDDNEDVKIVPDLEATKRKYEGRYKLPRKELPESEMEEKENRPSQNRVQASSKKKKNVALEEEDYDKPKLEFAPEM